MLDVAPFRFILYVTHAWVDSWTALGVYLLTGVARDRVCPILLSICYTGGQEIWPIHACSVPIGQLHIMPCHTQHAMPWHTQHAMPHTVPWHATHSLPCHGSTQPDMPWHTQPAMPCHSQYHGMHRGGWRDSSPLPRTYPLPASAHALKLALQPAHACPFTYWQPCQTYCSNRTFLRGAKIKYIIREYFLAGSIIINRVNIQ